MANLFKERYDEKWSDAMRDDPSLADGRKIAFVAVVTMASMRVIFFIVETLFIVVNDLSFSPLSFIVLCVSLLFGKLIHSGGKALAVLALLGGFWSLWQQWQDGWFIFTLFRYGDPLTIAYGISFIVAVLTTIGPMAYLLINPQYKKYAAAASIIQKELTEEGKAGKFK